jgi:hypothetical protein
MIEALSNHHRELLIHIGNALSNLISPYIFRNLVHDSDEVTSSHCQ